MWTLKQHKKQAWDIDSGRNGNLKATTDHSPPILSPPRENDPKRTRLDKHMMPTDKDTAQIDLGPHRDEPLGTVVSPNEAALNDNEQYDQNPPSPLKRPFFDGGTADTFVDNVDNDLTQITLQENETYNSEAMPSNTTTHTVTANNPCITTDNMEMTAGQQDTDLYHDHQATSASDWLWKIANLYQKGVRPNNRTYMAFWNYNIAVHPAKIKNGAVMKWIMNHLKKFFTKSKQLDKKFVL